MVIFVSLCLLPMALTEAESPYSTQTLCRVIAERPGLRGRVSEI